LEYLGADGSGVLKYIFNAMGGSRLHPRSLGQERAAGCSEDGEELFHTLRGIYWLSAELVVFVRRTLLHGVGWLAR
jgi:hypothetical protein